MIIYEDIFRAFQKKKVKYLIVGGIAANLLGALRSTADLDILMEITDENVRKVVGILKSLKYRIRQPIDPVKMVDKKVREDWIRRKGLKAVTFHKEGALSEIDIIVKSPVSFEEACKRSVMIKVGNIRLPVIAVDDLIKMKMRTGREIDKFDVHELKKIKKLRMKHAI